MKLTGENRSTERKTCPSATLSTINPTWTGPGSNPGLRSGKPAANRLSHGTALRLMLVTRGVQNFETPLLQIMVCCDSDTSLITR
jgi:hypothetical protein